MAKPTGFLEFGRQAPAERPPAERIRDWRSLHLGLEDEALVTQAARCMDCGIPFCHTGRTLAGMTSGCPISNLIPEWNDLVYRGQWREAYERLHKTNNFPEFTGLVCPAPCEAACTLGIIDPPVTIKSLEHAIVERAFAEGWVTPNAPATRTGKRVAIVGSGPAGLACADQLNLAGHQVVVYERDDRVGGLLTYGIPNMKLDKALVARRVALLEAAGVRFQTGVEVGADVAVADLREAHDAVVLCTGSRRPRDLAVPGRELAGIHYAMDYLGPNTRWLLAGANGSGPPLTAAGRDVVVIGGGDTGTDCVATALRHGCRGLTQLEILERPPDKRAPNNPWPQWPRVFRQDYGHEEAEAVFGADPRRFAVMTTAFLGDGLGRVRAVQTVDVRWEREDGRWQPRPLAGSEREWPAQLVLLAMGYLGPESDLPEQLGVDRDARGNLAAPEGSYETGAPGVFAAGDARRGQSLVVWAIREGRAAARAVDLWLMGETALP